MKGSLPRLPLQLLLFAGVLLNFIVSGQGKNPSSAHRHHLCAVLKQATSCVPSMDILRMHTSFDTHLSLSPSTYRSREEEHKLYFWAVIAAMRLAIVGATRWNQHERGVRGEWPEARTHDGRQPRICGRWDWSIQQDTRLDTAACHKIDGLLASG